MGRDEKYHRRLSWISNSSVKIGATLGLVVVALAFYHNSWVLAILAWFTTFSVENTVANLQAGRNATPHIMIMLIVVGLLVWRLL